MQLQRPRMLNGISICPPKPNKPSISPDPERYNDALYGNKRNKLGRRLIGKCCSDTELWESIQGKIREEPFTREMLSGVMSRCQIPKIPNAIEWLVWKPAEKGENGVPGHHVPRIVAGAPYGSWVLLLRVLLKEGIIVPAKYPPPPAYGILEELDLTAEPVKVLLKPEPKANVATSWCRPAKEYIASVVKTASIPAWDMVPVLITRGYRNAGSSLKRDTNVLWRQMNRMIGPYFSKEEFERYRCLHVTKKTITPQELEFLVSMKSVAADRLVQRFRAMFGRFISMQTAGGLLIRTTKPKGLVLNRKSEGSSGVTGSPWDKYQHQTLTAIVQNPPFPLSTSGRKNCRKAALILKREKVRVSATWAAVSKALSCLVATGENKQYGLTKEQYDRFCRPKSLPTCQTMLKLVPPKAPVSQEHRRVSPPINPNAHKSVESIRAVLLDNRTVQILLPNGAEVILPLEVALAIVAKHYPEELT